MFENVIVTSYVGRFSKLWYQWKGKTLPYTMVPHTHTLGMLISSSWGGGLGKCVTENTLGRRGLIRKCFVCLFVVVVVFFFCFVCLFVFSSPNACPKPTQNLCRSTTKKKEKKRKKERKHQNERQTKKKHHNNKTKFNNTTKNTSKCG